MGTTISYPEGTYAREVCVANRGTYAFEMRVPGCSTAFIATQQTKCVDLRNCQNPREGEFVYPVFDVVTGQSVTPSILYSDFGPKITFTCWGLTGDATCGSLVVEDRALPSDSCLNGKCYAVANREYPRDGGDAFCQYYGGRLASVASAEENEFIRRIAIRSYGEHDPVLLGWRGADNPDTWMDGTPVGYTNWSPGEPNRMRGYFPDQGTTLVEDSVEMNPRTGKWNDIFYLDFRNFVCEIPEDAVRDITSPIW